MSCDEWICRSCPLTSSRVRSRWISFRLHARSSTEGFTKPERRDMWKRGFKPKLAKNGEVPMDEWRMLLYANSVNGRNVVQSSWWQLTTHRRYCSNTLFTRSIRPSVCGWNVVDNFVMVSRIWKRLFHEWEMEHHNRRWCHQETHGGAQHSLRLHSLSLSLI